MGYADCSLCVSVCGAEERGSNWSSAIADAAVSAAIILVAGEEPACLSQSRSRLL